MSKMSKPKSHIHTYITYVHEYTNDCDGIMHVCRSETIIDIPSADSVTRFCPPWHCDCSSSITISSTPTTWKNKHIGWLICQMHCIRFVVPLHCLTLVMADGSGNYLVAYAISLAFHVHVWSSHTLSLSLSISLSR